MTTLYGPDGRPVDLAALKREHSNPTVTGVRSIQSEHPSAGLTPARLARLLRDAEDGDATQYLELAEDMEEKDLHYLAVLGTRKRQVCQLEITVEAATDDKDDVANADLVREVLARDEVEDELFNVLDAVGKGYSASEIVWDFSERQWMPNRIEWRDPRWFQFDRADGRTLLLRSANGATEPLAPYKFILHTHAAKSGLPIRGGLARCAGWAYLFKNFDVKAWVSFAEAYGQPIRVGKYHPSATQEEKDELLRAVRSISSDAAAIIPESMIIEFVKAEVRASVDLYQMLANFMDYQVSKAVLGQTTTTDAVSGGHAVSQEHDKVREDIERADSKQLAATLNRDLARPLIDLNRGPQKAYPRIRIGRKGQVDIAVMSEALARLVPAGLKVEQSVVRDMLGIPDPDPAAEMLVPPLQSIPFPPPATASARRPAIAADQVDRLADQADAVAAPAMDALIDRVRELMDESRDLGELQARLIELYPGLDAEALGEAIARALVVADLTGRDDVADAGDNG